MILRLALAPSPASIVARMASAIINRKFFMPNSYIGNFQKSITGLAVVSMCAFGFRLGLGHVCTGLGLAVVLRAGAVVDVTCSIYPHLTRATSGSLSGCLGCCLRCGWRGRWGRSRGWSGCSRCWSFRGVVAGAPYQSLTPLWPLQAPCFVAPV